LLRISSSVTDRSSVGEVPGAPVATAFAVATNDA